MKYLNLIGGLILILLMVVALGQSDHSVAQSPTTIALSDVQVLAGQPAIIEAHIDCRVGWCGDVSLTIHFDPTFIQVDSVEVGPYFGEQHLDITSIDNELGIVNFRATGFQDDSAGVDNVLFRLNVQPLDLGETMVDVTDIEVKDGEENIVDTASVSGRIEIDVDVNNLLAVLANYDWQIAFVSERDGNPEIYVMNADGSDPTRLTEQDARDDMPIWSPNGSRIVFVSERDGNPEIYVMNADGSDPTRLTEHDGVDEMPAWSPDGTQIVFVSEREGNRELFVMDADGSNIQRLTENEAVDEMPAWSPDGTRIAFISERDSDHDLYILDVESGDVSRVVAPVEGLEISNLWSYPAWSPDGTQIALTSAIGESAQLRIVALEAALDTPLSSEAVANNHLAWSRDARWLLFGAGGADNGDISFLFVEHEATQVLTSLDTNDYAPDLYDPHSCTVRTDDATIRVRVGPGFNRGIFGNFPSDQDIRVIGYATADDGSLWWEVDRAQIEGGETANTLWVAQDAVTASRRCSRVSATDAPPVIVGGQSNTGNATGQWGFCGSCNSCGPHPTNECVTSPDGVCLWDPTTCRNVTIVVDPGATSVPGQNCFSVSMNYSSTTGVPVSPAPSQSVNTASTCSSGAGFTSGTLVSVSTTDFMCTSCSDGSAGFQFDHWEGTCGIVGGSTSSFVIDTNCLATAVYRPVTIIY